MLTSCLSGGGSFLLCHVLILFPIEEFIVVPFVCYGLFGWFLFYWWRYCVLFGFCTLGFWLGSWWVFLGFFLLWCCWLFLGFFIGILLWVFVELTLVSLYSKILIFYFKNK